MYDRTIFENLESSYQQCILLIKIYVFIYLLSDFCHKIKIKNFDPTWIMGGGGKGPG